jgi:hypothetical protein
MHLRFRSSRSGLNNAIQTGWEVFHAEILAVADCDGRHVLVRPGFGNSL